MCVRACVCVCALCFSICEMSSYWSRTPGSITRVECMSVHLNAALALFPADGDLWPHAGLGGGAEADADGGFYIPSASVIRLETGEGEF